MLPPSTNKYWLGSMPLARTQENKKIRTPGPPRAPGIPQSLSNSAPAHSAHWVRIFVYLHHWTERVSRLETSSLPQNASLPFWVQKKYHKRKGMKEEGQQSEVSFMVSQQTTGARTLTTSFLHRRFDFVHRHFKQSPNSPLLGKFPEGGNHSLSSLLKGHNVLHILQNLMEFYPIH